MKIRTRLKLNTWLSLGLLTLMLISLGWSLWEANRANKNVTLVGKIERAAFERIMLRDDWLLYREERAKIQWYVKTETLRKLLESASQKFTSKRARELLQDARQDFNATRSLFTLILEKYQPEKHAQKETLVFPKAESRVLSQVFLKAYSLNDNIGRVRENALRDAETARDRLLVIIIFFVVGGIILIFTNSISLNKVIAKGVNKLTDGIKVIGNGNLDYQIATAGDDELADLARVVNEMTTKLKQSYTSVESLQREVAERKKAEDNIKKLSLHQQTLLAAIPDIIMEVDTIKIYTWANNPGIDFFGKDVIGKSADFYFVREQNTYDIVRPLFNGSDDLIYLESWQKRKDGQERLLAWWCRALKDAQGNVTGAISSARDITERVQAESQREAALEEIHILNEELEQRVAQRTAELSTKTAELERINKVFVDRELRMRELKERIAELEKKT